MTSYDRTSNPDGLVRYAQSLEQHNDKLQKALKNIVGWIDGQEGGEQIPPCYLIEAHSLLNREE